MQLASSCPHCNVVADVEPHAAFGFSCRVCGGPRVVVDATEVELGKAARAALKAAAGEHRKHLLFSAAGLGLLGLGAIGLVIASVVVLAAAPGLLATLSAFLAAGVPIAAGLWAMWRAATARQLRGEAMHGARVEALGDAQAVLGALDGPRIAELMRLDPEQAELLSAEASVERLLAQAAPPRLRVEGEPARTAIEDAGAELEAAAARTAREGTER